MDLQKIPKFGAAETRQVQPLVLCFTLILLQYLREGDNFSSKIARKRIKQNEFPKAFVGNCKPHTIFTAMKNLPWAGKQFFPPPTNFLLVVHTTFPVVCILSRATVSEQGEVVRRPVEKTCCPAGVTVKQNHSLI
jgi:hypothetical protein